MISRPPTSEERFYKQHYEKGRGSTEPGEAVAVELVFQPGGRYHVVRKALEGRPKLGRLLEIGCGGGEYTIWMQRFAERCVGCDIYLFPHLAGGEAGGATFVAANANERLPFEDASFDAVVAMMVMEHLFDPFHFCDEMRRILKPSGTLFLNVPLITSIKRRWQLLTGRMPVTSQARWFEAREWDGGHLHYFALRDVRRLLAVSGFEMTDDVMGVGRLHGLKTLLPTLLAGEISVAARKLPPAA